MIKIWGRASSSNVQAVMWCIGVLDLPYERIDAGYNYGVNDTAEYRHMNPNGTVPTIIDDDGPPLWESAAIVRYLARRYASAPFWPKDNVEQANVDRWAEWSKINIALTFTAPIFWKRVRTAPTKQNPELIRAAIDHFESKLQIAEDQLSNNRFLANDNLTIADIQFGHVLFRYFDIDIERRTFPVLQSYYRNLCDLDSYREHVMVNYDELRVSD